MNYIQNMNRCVGPVPGYTDKPTLEAVQVEPDFQSKVQAWMLACFGPEIASDKQERNHRFLEEALELVQSCNCTKDEAHQLVDYVFGRPVGEPYQEVGGVMVTLAALCLANSLDMQANGDTELARIWTKIEQIRAKQAAKPKHSPLPEVQKAVQAGPVADTLLGSHLDYTAKVLGHAAPQQPTEQVGLVGTLEVWVDGTSSNFQYELTVKSKALRDIGEGVHNLYTIVQVKPLRNVTKQEDTILRNAVLRAGKVIHPANTIKGMLK